MCMLFLYTGNESSRTIRIVHSYQTRLAHFLQIRNQPIRIFVPAQKFLVHMILLGSHDFRQIKRVIEERGESTTLGNE